MLKVLVAVGALLAAGQSAAAFTSLDIEGWEYGNCALPKLKIIEKLDGQEYGKARKVLVDQGWRPLENSEISTVAASDRLSFARDAGWFEVEDCSADGYCRMNFTNADGQVMRVISYSDRVSGGGLICKPQSE